jgi:hypothetical protein
MIFKAARFLLNFLNFAYFKETASSRTVLLNLVQFKKVKIPIRRAPLENQQEESQKRTS